MFLFIFLLVLLQCEGTAFASVQDEDKENRPSVSALNHSILPKSILEKTEDKQSPQTFSVIVRAEYLGSHCKLGGIGYVRLMFFQQHHNPRYFNLDWEHIKKWPVEFEPQTYYPDKPLKCSFQVFSTFVKQEIIHGQILLHPSVWQDTTFCGQIMPFNEKGNSLKEIAYVLTGEFEGKVVGYY